LSTSNGLDVEQAAWWLATIDEFGSFHDLDELAPLIRTLLNEGADGAASPH